MRADDGTGAAVISEVMWMGSDLSTSDEWVELACPVSGDCDLAGWTFTSLKSTGEEAVVIAFATGALIPAGAVRVLSNFPLSLSRLAAEPWMTTSGMSLPNSKLLLRLRDAAGTVRDEVDDGIGNPFAGANPSGGTKASMERIDLLVAGNVAENWRTADTSGGFKEGVLIFGSPGVIFSPPIPSPDGGGFSSAESSASSGSGSSESSESSSFLDSARDDTAVSSASSASSASLASSPFVFITEVLANPMGADTDEWIEIANLGMEIVNIAGWILDDGNSSAVYKILPRSGSDFFLAPGEHASFRKSVTALALDNSGERVSLMSGSLLIDAWEYPQTAEEVSFGRDPDTPSALRAFCVPTEGGRNAVMPLPSRIIIQDAGSAAVGSAYVQGTERVTLNLQAAVGAGSLASAACAWDFGDDAVSGVCNPPSHTYSDAGDYTVRLTVRDFCGGIAVSTLLVTVLPKEEETATSPSSSSSSSRSSASSSQSSAASLSTSSAALMSVGPIVRSETGVVLGEVLSVPTPGGEEWIELFNPTDHEISLGGWILDDLKDGGSKPFIIPLDAGIGAGEYRFFPKSETKLSLNDSGDDVWLIAPDEQWSDYVAVPKLKAGISFNFCGDAWRLSDPSPGLPNDCQHSAQSSSSVSARKSAVSGSISFIKTRYVLTSSDSSVSSASLDSSGSLMMSYALSELPPALTVTGPAAENSSVPEVGTLGALSGVGVVLIFLGRKWWFL